MLMSLGMNKELPTLGFHSKDDEISKYMDILTEKQGILLRESQNFDQDLIMKRRWYQFLREEYPVPPFPVLYHSKSYL
jgi:hypothetical protein